MKMRHGRLQGPVTTTQLDNLIGSGANRLLQVNAHADSNSDSLPEGSACGANASAIKTHPKMVSSLVRLSALRRPRSCLRPLLGVDGLAGCCAGLEPRQCQCECMP